MTVIDVEKVRLLISVIAFGMSEKQKQQTEKILNYFINEFSFEIEKSGAERAYDVDKVVEQLEKKRHRGLEEEKFAYEQAIKIVKRGGVE